jgi:hypothetical protein
MSSDTKEYTHSSYFFRKDIINEFTEKNITNKYRLRNIDDILKDCKHTKTKQQLIVDTIQYLFTNICTGVGSSYSEKMITKFINNPDLFDIAIILYNKNVISYSNQTCEDEACEDEACEDVKEQLNDAVGFIIVELGECQHFPNAYSVHLICTKSGSEPGIGTILMGLYLYTILSHPNKQDDNHTSGDIPISHVGVLELAASYENAGGLCMYEKFGFTYDQNMRINDKKGKKCFNDMDNLPMIVDLNKYIGNSVEEKQKMIIDITNGIVPGFEKSKICNIKNKDIQKLVGYLKILKHYFDFRISLNKNTRTNVIELYDLFDNNREVLDYIIKYVEETSGLGKNEFLNSFIANLILYNTKKRIQIGNEKNKEINDMINKITIVLAKKRQQTLHKVGGGRTIKKMNHKRRIFRDRTLKRKNIRSKNIRSINIRRTRRNTRSKKL